MLLQTLVDFTSVQVACKGKVWVLWSPTPLQLLYRLH